jgi:hypothetical protein
MMKRNFLSKLFQASLMCCLAVLFTACDEVFGSEDNPIPAYLSMDTSNVTLKVGETKTRTAIAVSTAIVEYSSSDPAIATVDANGTVTGVADGTATITATATGYSSASGKKMFNTESKSYKVTVVGGPAPAPALTMLQTPLTFEAAEAGAKVTFKASDDAVAKDIEYSLDGTTWTAVNTGGTGVSVTLANAGDKVMFRGTNAAYSDGTDQNSITCDKDCYIYGNIMSLIKKEDFENVTTFTADFTFRQLFKNNAKIKNHTDATKYLVLPATKMTAYCYYQMFFKCEALTTTPVINVDCDAKEFCMGEMFRLCSGLTTVAEGSKISGNMGNGSCSEMFSCCYVLESVPSDLLPSTSLANYCYYVMFGSCYKLEKAPKLPAETLKPSCYWWMFNGCTVLNEAWVKADYKNTGAECALMFSGSAATGTIHSKTGSNWDTQKGAAGIGTWTVNNDYND